MTKKELAKEIYKEIIRSGQKTILSEEEFVKVTLKGVGCLSPATKKELERELKVWKNK